LNINLNRRAAVYYYHYEERYKSVRSPGAAEIYREPAHFKLIFYSSAINRSIIVVSRWF